MLSNQPSFLLTLYRCQTSFTNWALCLWLWLELHAICPAKLTPVISNHPLLSVYSCGEFISFILKPFESLWPLAWLGLLYWTANLLSITFVLSVSYKQFYYWFWHSPFSPVMGSSSLSKLHLYKYVTVAWLSGPSSLYHAFQHWAST